MTLARVAACVLLLGCGDNSGTTEDDGSVIVPDGDVPADGEQECIFGDPTAPLEIELAHFVTDKLITSKPDDQIGLVIAPQGGWGVVFGVRVRNFRGCSAYMEVSFRDVCSSEPVASSGPRFFELRPTPDADGWGSVPVDWLPYILVCPLKAERNLYDNRFVFSAVLLEDVPGPLPGPVLGTSPEVPLIPKCPTSGDFDCTCECDRDYVGACPVTPTGAGVPSCDP